MFMFVAFCLAPTAASLPIVDEFVSVNLSSTTSFPHFFSNGVGSGHAALTTRADWREHMKTGHDAAGFKYVRYHAVLDDTSLYLDAPRNNKRASYFDVISTYSYLISIGVRPVVELSFTPSPVNNKTCDHFYYKGCENVPTNLTLYGDYVRNFTSAMTDYFGVDEVSSWYFEVYNEADLHWSFEQYFELYTAAAKAVKSVDQKLRVGGPSSAFPIWVQKLVEACANKTAPVLPLSTL
jgi:xylan 1,4-beta-xylosidase